MYNHYYCSDYCDKSHKSAVTVKITAAAVNHVAAVMHAL